MGILNFLSLKKNYGRIEKRNSICINVFRYKNGLVYPVHVSGKKNEDCMDLLLIENKNIPHYVYIKDFNRLMCNKTNDKNKKHFCRYCLQYFSSKIILIEHKEVYWIKINGKQSKLRHRSI